MARAGLRRSLTIVGAVVWLCVAMPAVAAAGPMQPTGPIPPVGTIHTIELPGGVEGIRRAIGDRRPTSRASVVIEMARRFHGGTSDAAGDDPILARLRTWLRACVRERGCEAAGLAPDRVPLPGAPAMWRDVVFERRRQRGVAGVAILGPLRQAAEDDAAQAARHGRDDLVRRGRRVVGHRHQQRHQIGRDERPAAGDQLVERRAEAVDVGAGVERGAAQLLGEA